MKQRIEDARKIIERNIERKEDALKAVIEEIARCSKRSTEYMGEGNFSCALDYIDTIARQAKAADELRIELKSLKTQLQVVDFIEKEDWGKEKEHDILHSR